MGIFLPAYDELFIYGVTSKVTSDCLIDRLVEWWEMVRLRFAHITTLVINLDNGPENHSRRTQFLRRTAEFAQLYALKGHRRYRIAKLASLLCFFCQLRQPVRRDQHY